MKRKYLDDIGVVDRPDLWKKRDKRQKEWTRQRKEYGFDERETWCLDFSFYCWLYERCKMFLDKSCIDLNFHKFEYEGETFTQEQCINKIIEGCEIAITVDDWNWTKEQEKQVADVAKIWAIILPAMWW